MHTCSWHHSLAASSIPQLCRASMLALRGISLQGKCSNAVFACMAPTPLKGSVPCKTGLHCSIGQVITWPTVSASYIPVPVSVHAVLAEVVLLLLLPQPMPQEKPKACWQPSPLQPALQALSCFHQLLVVVLKHQQGHNTHSMAWLLLYSEQCPRQQCQLSNAEGGQGACAWVKLVI